MNKGKAAFAAAGIFTSVLSVSLLSLHISAAEAEQDIIPPTISISVSKDGSQPLSGEITVGAFASDDIGVAGVTLLVDDIEVLPEVTTPPYQFIWNSTAFPNGTHAFSGRARDAAGNESTSAIVNIRISNTVPFPSPAPNSSNLIQNPSMETAGLNGDPDHWFRGNWGTNTAVFSYPTSGSNGKGAKVAITSYTEGDAKWYFEDVPVTPGSAYAFDMRYTSSTDSYLVARYTTPLGFLYDQITGPMSPKNETSDLQLIIQPPTNTISMTLFHLIKSVGEIIVDQYSLFDINPNPSPAPTPSLGPNLIQNPSFETQNPDGTFPHWNQGAWGTNTASFEQIGAGYTSNTAVSASIDSYVDGDAKWYFDDVNVAPGHSYRFSDAYYATAPTEVVARYTMTDGSFLYIDIAYLSSTPTWQQFSKTIMTPENAVSLTVFHLINKTDVAGHGTLAVDNFSLQEIQ